MTTMMILFPISLMWMILMTKIDRKSVSLPIKTVLLPGCFGFPAGSGLRQSESVFFVFSEGGNLFAGC
jgi:hypothetical protein